MSIQWITEVVRPLTALQVVRPLFLAATLAVTPAALAALGQDPASIARDGAVQGPSARAFASTAGSTAALSSVVQSQTVLTPQGVTVTEYFANGVVFALTWNGAVMPDLSGLLGTYFPGYQVALQNRPRAGRNAPVAVQTDQIVVHSAGHMRAFTGMAYVPPLVPSGFDITLLEAH
jgi:hypothetical protein